MTVTGATTDEIRTWANGLPEATEHQHHLFKVPLWQVRGKTVLRMGREETSAVFFIEEASTNAAAAEHPDHGAAVHHRTPDAAF